MLSHHRAIQTVQELRLLIQIYESQQRFTEVVKILDSKNLGLDSRIVQNDQVLINLKAVNLGAGKMWDEGIAFAKQLYTIPDDEKEQKAIIERDDWKIWNLLVESTRNSSVPGLVLKLFQNIQTNSNGFYRVVAETREFIEKFIEFNPKSRNAALALIDATVVGIQKGENSSDHLLSACYKYLDNHKHKLYAFEDIRTVLDGNKDHMAEVLNHLSDIKGEDDKVSHLILNLVIMSVY